MFRAIGKAIVTVLTLPIRLYRAVVGAIVATRRFLDTRRRHLCVAIVAAMMVVVGVRLRQPGDSDVRLSQYVSAVWGLGRILQSDSAAPANAGSPQSPQKQHQADDSPSQVTASNVSLIRPAAQPEPTLPTPTVVDLTEFQNVLQAEETPGTEAKQTPVAEASSVRAQPPSTASLVGTIEESRQAD